MKTIHFKRKTGPLLLGIGLIMLLTPMLFAFIDFLFRSEMQITSKIVVAIVGIVWFVPFYGVAILSFKKFYIKGKILQNGLKKYGEDKLIQNIQDNTISEYKNPTGVVYFTDKLIIDPRECIIDYNEISLMYKYIYKSSRWPVAFIGFELMDGSHVHLCSYIEDKELQEYMHLCRQYNPEILFEYSSENLDKHKERVMKYKNGEIVIPELKL